MLEGYFNELHFIEAIEKLIEPEEVELPSRIAHIYDGMVVLQQASNIPLETFGDLSEYIFSRIIKDVNVVYFVTDRYMAGSIKSYERGIRKEKGSIRYRIERRDQKRTKQWKKYMKDSDNKIDLVQFLFQDWSDPSRFSSKLAGKTLYFNIEDRFHKLTCVNGEVNFTYK